MKPHRPCSSSRARHGTATVAPGALQSAWEPYGDANAA